VPFTLRYGAGRRRRGVDLVVDADQLGRLAEVVAGAEGGQVGLAHRRLVANFFSIQSVDGSVGRPYIHGDRPSANRFLQRCGVGGLDALDALGGAHRHRVIGTRKSW
jgi:hypothetical protein